MTYAEFEEREYERPLYNELGVAHNRLWSPGQVLERRVGIDSALFSLQPLPHGVHGPTMPPGVIPAHYWHFFRHDLGVPANRKLPNFLLNVFLQAKRPRYLKTSAKSIAAAGVRGPHWAFAINDDQQSVLEKLQAKFSGKAVVSYAAPVFHTEKHLYRHTISGNVAEKSTYPNPSSLQGHSHWHYKVPGAVGVAKSSPVAVEDQPLKDRVNDLARSDDIDEALNKDWVHNLWALSDGILQVMEHPQLAESFRRARYFYLQHVIEAEAKFITELPPWWVPYQKIVAFVATYKLVWFCVE